MDHKYVWLENSSINLWEISKIAMNINHEWTKNKKIKNCVLGLGRWRGCCCQTVLKRQHESKRIFAVESLSSCSLTSLTLHYKISMYFWDYGGNLEILDWFLFLFFAIWHDISFDEGIEVHIIITSHTPQHPNRRKFLGFFWRCTIDRIGMKQ